MEKRIPLSVPNLKGNELNYIQKAIEAEWVSTGGGFITDFENRIAGYTRGKAAAACQSGTAGIHLALLALGVKPGDEVLVPTLTFIAAVNPVRYAGAEPVFMDCDDSLCLDPCKLECFLKEECEITGDGLKNCRTGRIIRAVIVVHVFGNMADMEAIKALGHRYGLKVIEDATEALGTYYTKGSLAGRFAGTIGHMGVFSFNGNKIITTGGGGMVVSQDKSLVERCRYLSTQAKDDAVYFVHNEIGYNYRMTNLQAAMGLAQLEQLESFIQTKKENYMEYGKRGIPLLPFREGTRPNYWFYSCLSEDRDELIRFLAGKNIEARPVWTLIHTLKPYEHNQSYRIEKAVFYHNKIVNLPCSSNLGKEEIKRVVEEIGETWAERR